MADKEKLLTPEGEISGLALYVAPSSPGLDLPLFDSRIADPHHGEHVDSHKKRAYFSTPAGAALRNIQLELLEVELHNFGTNTYHDFYKGILLPPQSGVTAEYTDVDVFSRIVPAASGNITRRVIDLNDLPKNGGKPLIRDMTDAEYAFFSTPHPDGERMYKHTWFKEDPVKFFLKLFMGSHDFKETHFNNLRTLFETNNMQERRNAGHAILTRLVEIVPLRIAKRYPLVERAGLLEQQAAHEPKAA